MHHSLTLLRLCVPCLYLLSGAVAAAGAHTHGKARLDISIDADRLTLALEAPLDSLVGFERAPANTNEQDRVRKAAEKLRAADRLFLINAEAGCKLQGVRLASAAITPALLGEAPEPKAAAGKDEGHADLDGEFVFRCDKPASLKSVTVNLFDAFPLLRGVDARVASARGQHAAKLSGTSRTLGW